MRFKKAEKKNVPIKIAISGTGGSGKTYGALLIAQGLGGRTALLDTEYKSASFYADEFDFDVLEDSHPNGFPPEYFIDVIRESVAQGYQNLIIDSLSHEWSGRGGCLELSEMIARAKYKGNTFAAWAEVTPRHNALVNEIVSSNINIIATMRSKAEYVVTKDEKSGRATPQKIGLGAIQRDGIEYEFSIMLELDNDSHFAAVSKDRTNLFKDPFLITADTGRRIAAWLSTPKTETARNNLHSTKNEKLDPYAYIVADIEERIKSGETPESIQIDYAQILKTDALRPAEMLTNGEQKLVATELFFRKNPNARKPQK